MTITVLYCAVVYVIMGIRLTDLLALPMQRLLSSKEEGCKDHLKSFKPCHVGIYWIVLPEYSQMSTHVPGFVIFYVFLSHFVLAK